MLWKGIPLDEMDMEAFQRLVLLDSMLADDLNSPGKPISVESVIQAVRGDIVPVVVVLNKVFTIGCQVRLRLPSS